MQNYEIPPTWPNIFFPPHPKHLPNAPKNTPKTLKKSFPLAKTQVTINQLPTPYQLLTNSYHGRSW